MTTTQNTAGQALTADQAAAAAEQAIRAALAAGVPEIELLTLVGNAAADARSDTQ